VHSLPWHYCAGYFNPQTCAAGSQGFEVEAPCAVWWRLINGVFIIGKEDSLERASRPPRSVILVGSDVPSYEQLSVSFQTSP